MSFDRANLLKLLASREEPNENWRLAVEQELEVADFYKQHNRPLIASEGQLQDARAPRLAWHAIMYAKQHGAAAAAEALDDLFQMTEIDGETWAFVENVITLEVVSLGGGVIAVPEDQAPSAMIKEAMDSARGPMNHRQGALLKATDSGSPFIEAPSDRDITFLLHLSKRPAGLDRIEDALKMITLCGPCSPVMRFIATQKPHALRLFGASGQFSIGMKAPGYHAPGMPKEITAEPAELISGYSTLTDTDRRRIDIAISRLRTAVGRGPATDAIVDLCIALEAILSDLNNSNELSYKLRIRAALILETELDPRKACKKLVSDLYVERSKIVHGAIPASKASELRERGEALLTRLIKRIIQIRRIPDWQEIELTNGIVIN